MSGIQSLLKYRFTKRDAPKVDGASSSASSSVSNSQSSSPNSSSQANGIIRSNRGAPRIHSDSEPESPIKASSSNTSSPWLSKQTGMMHNGFQKSPSVSSSSPLVSSTSSLKPTLSSQDTIPYSVSNFQEEDDEEEDELDVEETNRANLQEMFPNTATDVIEAAIKNSNQFDEAVDYVINHNKSLAVKRKFSRIRTIDSDDEDVMPVKKRARPLIESQSSQDTIVIDDDDAPSTSEAGAAATNGHQPKPFKTYVEKVKFLQEAFPDIPKDMIELTLQGKEFDLDQAALTLGTMSAPKGTPPKPVSTVSKGSIKDFKAARVMNKMAGNVHHDYEEDAETFTPAKGIGAKLKVKKVRTQYSDDEDDNYSDDDSEGGGGGGDEDNGPIVGFFNEAMTEELMSMQGCSKKKAQQIMAVRPFTSWDDLVNKIDNSKDLGFQLITSCKEVLRIRGIVNKLMNNCKRIASEMESIIADITSKTSLDERDRDKGYIDKQPETLNSEMKLKPYQMVGLNWLILMHDQELNGILGDEMGLGKTIQTVAFLTYLTEMNIPGPHVVVAPSSTLDNWLREMSLWSPNLRVMLYYGSQEERREVRAQIADGSHEEFDVVMTTYNMASGSNEDRALFKKLKFNYAVFDEGHMLKNMSSMRYQSLMKIRASRRLLLTGTPLQNNLVELMSLLAFVMPDLFVGKTDHIKRIFTSITSKSQYESKGGYEKEVIGNAKNILKPFFLRRLKRDVLQQLPDKIDVIEKVAMDESQQQLYDGLRTEFTDAVRKAGGEAIQGQAGSAMMMQLRKAANHQLLHRKHYDNAKLKRMAKLYAKDPAHPDANADYVYEDMEVMSDFELNRLCKQEPALRSFALDPDLLLSSGKFRYLDSMLPGLKDKGSRVLLFSQFTMVMDIMEVYMKARKYKYLRLDGSTPVQERQDLIDVFNKDSAVFVFLLSTKAGGLGINLTAADTVILHDIDFNPYNDKQAEDRCHRVGQTKPVSVYRLISKDTIEEGMLRCAQAKLRLEQDVTGQAQDEEEDPSNVASLLKEALAIEKS